MNKIKKSLMFLFCLLPSFLAPACNNSSSTGKESVNEVEIIEESVLQKRIDSGYFDEADSRYYWCFRMINIFIINSSETSNKKFNFDDFPELDILYLSEEVRFNVESRRTLHMTLNIEDSLEVLKPYVIKLTNNKYVYDVEYESVGIEG